MSLPVRRWAFLLSLLTFSAGTFAAPTSARAEVSGKRKKPDEQTPPPPQDPMEVENSTLVKQQPQPQRQPPPPPHHNNNPSTNPSNENENTGQPPPPPTEKAGRFIASFKIGPAICLYNCAHQGALLVELGYSVLPNKNAYLILPLQFQFAPSGSVVMVPLGFQYDLAVPAVPGLYFYPRISIGYALIIDNVGAGTPTTHGAILLPEFGVKYVYHGRYNIGGEFFSLPMLFGDMPSGSAQIFYRILLSVGVNF